MTNHFSRRWLFLALILASLMLSACQPSSGASPDAETTSAPVVEPEQLDLVLGTGPFFLPDTRAGLAELASYKATLIVAFDGIVDGQAQQWMSTYAITRSKEPLTRQLTIENSGDIPGADPVFLAESEGSTFEIGAGGNCSINVIDPQFSPIDWLEPAGMLSALLGADEAGQEDLSGVAADHYSFDERAIAQSGLAESTGEIWVASDGGYILKYVLTTTGDANYFGEGIEGSMSWDYVLTDINMPFATELPAACRDLLVSAPRLPDASNVLNLPGWLGYETAGSVVEVAAFYQEQLPVLGWTPPLQSIVDPAGAFLEFTQGDQTMKIVIAAGEFGTEVNILLTSPEE